MSGLSVLFLILVRCNTVIQEKCSCMITFIYNINWKRVVQRFTVQENDEAPGGPVAALVTV